MEAHEPEPSPDRFRMTVNGAEFEVAYDPSQPGAYHYTRLTEPASGYGFTARLVREVISRDMLTAGQRQRIREAVAADRVPAR